MLDVRCLVLIALIAAPAFAAPPAIEWSFDERPVGISNGKEITAEATGEVRLDPKGVSGSALNSRAAFQVPAAFAADATLSFHYRLPPKPADKKAAQKQYEQLRIVSLGEHVLTYEKNRLRWYRPGKGEGERKAWLPKHSFLTPKKFVLLEIGWSAEQGCFLFADGLAVARMDAPHLSRPETPTVRLSFENGAFDSARLEPDATKSGARYTGVISAERFDGDKLPQLWAWYNRGKWKGDDALKHIPGFNGSKGAVATPTKDGRYFSMYCPVGFFRVTDDTYLCAAVFATNGSEQTCMVRAWPKVTPDGRHVNHWLRSKNPPGKWTPKKTSLARYKLPSGYIAQGFSFGARGPAERSIAIDNVVLFRGKDETPPAKVAGLKAVENDEGVKLTWKPAQDGDCVAGYVVYWSNVPKFRFDDGEVAGRTLDLTFTHKHVTHAGTYYYAVAAEDLFGNRGLASDPVKMEIAD